MSRLDSELLHPMVCWKCLIALVLDRLLDGAATECSCQPNCDNTRSHTTALLPGQRQQTPSASPAQNTLIGFEAAQALPRTPPTYPAIISRCLASSCAKTFKGYWSGLFASLIGAPSEHLLDDVG